MTEETLELEAVTPEPAPRGRATGILVRALAAVCLIAIAALAFRVSFRAISEVWVRVGAGDPADAWIAPLLIDGLIVVASLNALANAVDGRRVIYPWVLVAAASAVSVTANVAHAAPSLGARALAACAPMVLLAAAELVVRDLRRALEVRHHQPAPRPAPAPAKRPQPPVPPLVINNHNHITNQAQAGARADAAALTTPHHAGDAGEEITAGIPDSLTSAPHRGEITAPAPRGDLTTVEDLTGEAEESLITPARTTPRRHHTARRTTPGHTTPSPAGDLTVDAVWEQLLTTATAAASRGERYGWRAIQRDTGLSEHRAKRAAERLAEHLTTPERT